MSIERGRQAAYDLLPTFRDRVDCAEDAGTLWIELWDCEVAGILDEPITEEEILSLFSYASWCLLSRDENCQNAAIVDFYEMLPTNARIRSNLHRYLSVEDFLGLKNLFEDNLSEKEYLEFVEEFMNKATKEKEARAPIEDGA